MKTQVNCGEKSHVGMILCSICQEPFEILLETRIVKNLDGERELKKSLCKNNIIPGRVCDKCEKQYLSKGIMLMNPKTGSLVVIKDDVLEKLMDINDQSRALFAQGKIKRRMFTSEDVIQSLLNAPVRSA